MPHYLDTSLLIAALVEEPSSETARGWLEDRTELFISHWVETEFSSAMAIKVRTNQIDQTRHSATLGAWRQMVDKSFSCVQVSESHFSLAAHFCDQYQSGIRSGDALHLALASSEGLVLATLDRKLAQAGQYFGATTILIGD